MLRRLPGEQRTLVVGCSGGGIDQVVALWATRRTPMWSRKAPRPGLVAVLTANTQWYGRDVQRAHLAGPGWLGSRSR